MYIKANEFGGIHYDERGDLMIVWRRGCVCYMVHPSKVFAIGPHLLLWDSKYPSGYRIMSH